MSVLPFPSFLDDIKEKGVKKATFEGIDYFVKSITAGMNIQDVREALRGEAPSRRPNPRLQPHADGFWLHMRPSYFHQDMTGLYPTFRLGWLSTYFVVFETITGLFLMLWYTPSPEIAYGNMLSILSNVPLGKFMRDMHRLGAEAMVIIVFLHMLRTFYTGSYKKPRQFTWFTGVILLLVTLVLSFSGYLLPWDQLALWAVTIGASMVEAAPPADLVGSNLNLLVRGGPDMGANGLLRFYLLHVLLLPILLAIFTGVHYYKVIIHGHSLPPQKENIGEDTAKRVPLDKRVYFIPDVLTSEMMWIGTTTFVLVVLSTWFFKAPLESHANPQVTPLHTVAPWYFLWIQGALKLGDKVFWGLVFPGLAFGFLAVVPYIDATPSRRYADRRFAMTVSFVLLAALVIFSYWGTPFVGVQTAGDTEVLAEMIPDEHAGYLRPIPNEQLVVGAYTTAQFEGDNAVAAVEEFQAHIEETGQYDQMMEFLINEHGLNMTDISFTTVPSDAPELLHAVEEMEHMLHTEYSQELNDSWGVVIVTQAQDSLKRTDVLVSWNNVVMDGRRAGRDENGDILFVLDEDGEPLRRVNGRYTFVHENSDWFHR